MISPVGLSSQKKGAQNRMLHSQKDVDLGTRNSELNYGKFLKSNNHQIRFICLLIYLLGK